MEHGSQTDNTGGFFYKLSHGPLACISVSDHLRHRTVITDRSRQYKRNLLLYTAVYDPIVDFVIFNELGDRSAPADPVDHVQMVIMAIGHGNLGIVILSQGRMEESPLQIMGRQRISSHQSMGIPILHKRLHRFSDIMIKGKCRSHDP